MVAYPSGHGGDVIDVRRGYLPRPSYGGLNENNKIIPSLTLFLRETLMRVPFPNLARTLTRSISLDKLLQRFYDMRSAAGRSSGLNTHIVRMLLPQLFQRKVRAELPPQQFEGSRVRQPARRAQMGVHGGYLPTGMIDGGTGCIWERRRDRNVRISMYGHRRMCGGVGKFSRVLYRESLHGGMEVFLLR